MTLGGFVIHGACQATLGACLDSVAAVADACVAVGSEPGGRAAELARARGFRAVRQRWEGYGAARAAAVELLGDCDYVFFLDSDEWLEPAAIAQLRAWKASSPSAPHYALRRRDWAELGGGRRFRYRTESHVRLVRRDLARWDPSMVVHEALAGAPRVKLDIHVEHLFADDLDAMWDKVERYALLWAIRFHAERRAVKPAAVQWVVHLLRETLLKGALFRGGLPAVQLARAVAHHHARKYTLLGEVRRGAHRELVRAFDEGRLDELFRLLAAREAIPLAAQPLAGSPGIPPSRAARSGG
jgi:(heptosyl)LPS beta-1,4-glucosyltransferase